MFAVACSCLLVLVLPGLPFCIIIIIVLAFVFALQSYMLHTGVEISDSGERRKNSFWENRL